MSNQKFWVIESKTEKDDDGSSLFWSNADGWVDIEFASIFSDDEKNRLNLPIGGAWVEF